MTDETYRSEFRKEILDELRQTFAVRVVYLRVRAADTEADGARRGRARGPSPGPSGR